MEQTWLAKIIDISYPELMSFGVYCLWGTLVMACLGCIFWYLGRRRFAFACLFTTLTLLVLAFICIDDSFCIAGYLHDDDCCAWE